jgi:hypothetical protein
MVEVTCRAACHRRGEPRCAKAPDRREILARIQPLLVGHAVDPATGQPPPRTMAVQPTPQLAQAGLRTQRQTPPGRPRSGRPDPCPSNHRGLLDALVSMANTAYPMAQPGLPTTRLHALVGRDTQADGLPQPHPPAGRRMAPDPTWAHWPSVPPWPCTRGGRFWRPRSHPLWMMLRTDHRPRMAGVACRARSPTCPG